MGRWRLGVKAHSSGSLPAEPPRVESRKKFLERAKQAEGVETRKQFTKRRLPREQAEVSKQVEDVVVLQGINAQFGSNIWQVTCLLFPFLHPHETERHETPAVRGPRPRRCDGQGGSGGLQAGQWPKLKSQQLR